MTLREFHNAMRILLNIDGDEFLRATTGKDEPVGYWRNDPKCREWRDWEFFRDHPHEWFLRAPTEKAEAIYALIESRQPHIHVKDTSRPTDACAKCGLDIRNPIHERARP